MRKSYNFNGNKFIIGNDEVKEFDIGLSSMIALSISKREVEKKNFDRIFKTIETLKKSGKKARKKLVITFEYDDVPDEIYTIKSIREWTKRLFEKYPYLLYFINHNFFNNADMLLACLSDVHMLKIKNSTDVQLNIEMKKQLYEHLLKSTAIYSLCTLQDSENNTDDILSTFQHIMRK